MARKWHWEVHDRYELPIQGTVRDSETSPAASSPSPRSLTIAKPEGKGALLGVVNLAQVEKVLTNLLRQGRVRPAQAARSRPSAPAYVVSPPLSCPGALRFVPHLKPGDEVVCERANGQKKEGKSFRVNGSAIQGLPTGTRPTPALWQASALGRNPNITCDRHRGGPMLPCGA
jgi:hypothetical protein